MAVHIPHPSSPIPSPRVVSLLPSATEILCAVDGRDLLVGRSHECDWPAGLGAVPVLTAQRTTATTSAGIDEQVRQAGEQGAASLYTLDVERLRALQPDVILTQDLCEVCSIDAATVRAAAAELPSPPTIVSLDPKSLEDVFDDVLTVGEAVGRRAAADRCLVELRERYYSALDYVNAYIPGQEVVFLEWMDPLYVGGHWTPQLIEAAGGRHSLNAPGVKSRLVTPEQLVAAQPQHVVICPCGYDLAAIRRELETLTAQRWWGALPAVADGQIALVDGNAMFNRPGPRLVDAACWLVGWLQDRPEVIPADFPVELPPRTLSRRR